jgi:hypothetical protein
MLIVCVLFGLAFTTSVGFFCYQLYRFWATAGLIVRTSVPWPLILGHLLRAAGLGYLCWRLAKVVDGVNSAEASSDEFALRQRRFWKASAWVLSLLAVYAVFEISYTSRRDTYGFFRPEFESGFVEISPDRLEVRRASEEPVIEWVRMKVRSSEKDVFVSPVAEIIGKDIRRAVVRIAELFPGHQAAELHIQFTGEGAAKMERLTRSHLTKPLAVLVDGKVRAAPRVFTPILSGDAQLTNVFTLEEAAAMIRGESSE